MLAKVLPVLLRELMWLFGALIAGAFLAVGLRVLLQQNAPLHEPLLLELPADPRFSLKLLLFGLCLLGVYLGRLAVAAVGSLAAANG